MPMTNCHVSDAVTKVHCHQLPTAIAESFVAKCTSTVDQHILLLLNESGRSAVVSWFRSLRLLPSIILGRIACLARLSAFMQTLS